MKQLTIILLAVLLSACVSVREKIRKVPSPEILYARIAELWRDADRRDGFRGTAHFSYRDRDQDLHFVMDIRHDRKAGFTRIAVTGSLDGALWGELVVRDSVLKAYFPLERRAWMSLRSTAGLQGFGNVRVSLDELLRLVELKPAIAINGRVRGAAAQGENDVLFVDYGPKEWSACEFNPLGQLVSVRQFHDGVERGRIVYENYDLRAGYPAKQTIESRAFSMRAIFWIAAFNPGWRYTAGDEQLELPAGVVLERLQ